MFEGLIIIILLKTLWFSQKSQSCLFYFKSSLQVYSDYFFYEGVKVR